MRISKTNIKGLSRTAFNQEIKESYAGLPVFNFIEMCQKEEQAVLTVLYPKQSEDWIKKEAFKSASASLKLLGETLRGKQPDQIFTEEAEFLDKFYTDGATKDLKDFVRHNTTRRLAKVYEFIDDHKGVLRGEKALLDTNLLKAN